MRRLALGFALAVPALFSRQDSAIAATWPTVGLSQIGPDFGRVTEVAPANDGSNHLFVAEKSGIIKLLAAGASQAPVFLDIQARVGDGGSEQGLLGLAFSPTYASDHTFFVNYTDNSGDTVVSAFTAASPLDGDEASEHVVLKVEQPAANHNGGHLVFGPDGWLYIGMGDGGGAGDQQNHAQTDGDKLGKLLRYNPASGALETWAKGLRNPWKFSFDRATGDLYVADVGQNQWEEVDFAAAGSGPGKNYGWRFTEGTHCYNPATGCSTAGLTLPVSEYSHGEGCSITGGYVSRGTDPALAGIYLFSDYCSGTIWGLRRDAEGRWERSKLGAAGGNVATFGEGEDGAIYVVVESGSSARIYRISGQNGLPQLNFRTRIAAIASDR